MVCLDNTKTDIFTETEVGCMTQGKKVMVTILAIVLFVAVILLFTNVLKDSVFVTEEPEQSQGEMIAYPRPVTEETGPEQAQPAETEETVPATETIPEETVPETEPRIVYDAVPLFYMTDYPEVLYRSGTLATSGSNVACLAMVASYLTGHEYKPDALADYFADYIGNSMQWLEYASDELQLPWEKAANFHVAKQALQEGKIVITLMGERSIFTQTQHFIVLTGINDEGKITVNDPYAPHYTQWNLEDGLASGFEDVSIITGYLGSWIYDPAGMSDMPFLYEAEQNTDEFRYPGIELTQEDKDLMAKVLCMEAESEPFEAQQAIAEVILNRLAAGNFQSSIKSIVYAEGQFESVNRLYLAEPTHIQYEAIERAYNGPYRVPKDVVFFSTGKVNENVYEKIGTHWFCYQW